MAFALDQNSVSNLIEFVDRNVQDAGCDHSHRFSAAWAQQSSVNWDDLRDALEAAGAFCDCEVVLNLDAERTLTFDPMPKPADHANRWLLPPNFAAGPVATTSKIILSRAGVGRNTHSRDGERLVPAPFDVKPRNRVRNLVHFFIGVETGLPSEVGVVIDIEPILIADFAATVRKSPFPELHEFDQDVSSFVLGKIAKLPDGTPVGTDILEVTGIAAKHRELNVHRVILRR